MFDDLFCAPTGNQKQNNSSQYQRTTDGLFGRRLFARVVLRGTRVDGFPTRKRSVRAGPTGTFPVPRCEASTRLLMDRTSRRIFRSSWATISKWWIDEPKKKGGKIQNISFCAPPPSTSGRRSRTSTWPNLPPSGPRSGDESLAADRRPRPNVHPRLTGRKNENKITGGGRRIERPAQRARAQTRRVRPHGHV